jgi:hypothetical protein
MKRKIQHKKRPPFVFLIVLISVVALNSTGCKKLVETPIPTDQLAENAVYSQDATAIQVLNEMYISMNTTPFQGSNSVSGNVSLFAGLSADEYTLASGITNSHFLGYYQNALSQKSSETSGGEHWSLLFNLVFRCNAAIQGINNGSLIASVKQQLLGEAKFMRALAYFYLVNEFGDVPLVLSTDPKTNTVLARATQTSVYDQIIADLVDAKEKLSPNYLDITLLKTTSERVRPTQWAARALLARVYLYTQKYDKAEEEASSIISNTTSYALLPLNNVFLKNSKEAIFQIQPTDVDFNTQEGNTLVIPSTGPSTGGAPTNPVYLTKTLLASFELGDKRAVFGNWIDTTIYSLTSTTSDTVAYPYKYKVNNSLGVNNAADMTEYFMVLRLGEQYLIRAEARAKLGNINRAEDDLNAIRTRAGLPNTTANDQASLLTAILNERRHELFSEWGHRWFDLKRTGKADEVMAVVTPLKAAGAAWQSYQQLYPVPLDVLISSPNVTPTNGY